MITRLQPLWGPECPALFDHVRSHLPTDGSPGLTEGGELLPDEGELDGEIRWAPGALDGVVGHHADGVFGHQADREEVDRLVTAVITALRRAAPGRRGRRARRRVYMTARSGDALNVVDPVLDHLQQIGQAASTFIETARWLAFEGRHREPVKLGIALLGLANAADDRERLKVLGRHEEFTLYVAVALATTAHHPERELFELAQAVDGWGRIQIVERLRDTRDPEIRDWIYYTGFRNTVMNEYLAYIAATTGRMLDRLAPGASDQTLDAACDIVSALIAGGPAEDMDDYVDGPAAVIALLELLEQRASTLAHFLVTDDIERFVQQREAAEGDGTTDRWKPDVRHRALELCTAIKSRPHWDALATDGLQSDDDITFYRAERTARLLGHDTFAAHQRRLREDPINGDWGAVMQLANDDRLGEVITLAERSLPLDEIATGPDTVLGLGPEWAAHLALDSIVQDLGPFPGRGWPLVRAALNSPVVRNRNMAINALDAWGRRSWPDETVGAVEAALAAEPDDEVRSRLAKLAAGHPLDDSR